MNGVTGRQPLVLVVDDDEMTRVVIEEALESEGLRVVSTADGEAGLDLFRRASPDIVLLDVSMPGMGGIECCRRIRQSPGGERVPILVLTAHDDDQSIKDAFDARASDFVSKPVRWPLLAHRVRYLLRTSETVEKLSRSQSSLSQAQELAHVGNWEWRVGNRLAEGSTELHDILGLDPKCDVQVPESFLQCVSREEERHHVRRKLADLVKYGTGYVLEHRIVRPDGTERVVVQCAEARRDEQGHIVLLRGTLQDITEQKLQQTRLEYLATHDALTALPNRHLLEDRIAQSLVRFRQSGQRLALMLLDLDGFKNINDTLGHAIGDRVLIEVARRLATVVRPADTVARLGGDEFVILLSNVDVASDASAAASRILERLSEPLQVDHREIHSSASIGISVYPNDGGDANALMRCADMAMYDAKSLGGDSFRFFSSEMNARVTARFTMEEDLRLALQRGELFMHFQPQLSLASGAISGAEALVRWRHPTRGMVPPSKFIPVAEESGLIQPLGEWVIANVCAQCRSWLDAGLHLPTIGVNLSARQFRQKSLVPLIVQSLSANRLDPGRLELEITESTLMHDVQDAIAKARQLKRLGVRISLDDFGTGYSSLSYLKRIPVDRLKIDQSFVRDIATDPDSAAICNAVISLAHSLGLAVIAEGVETEAQRSYLRRQGCDEIQGYLFSRPLPADEFAQLLAEARSLALPAGA